MVHKRFFLLSPEEMYPLVNDCLITPLKSNYNWISTYRLVREYPRSYGSLTMICIAPAHRLWQTLQVHCEWLRPPPTIVAMLRTVALESCAVKCGLQEDSHAFVTYQICLKGAYFLIARSLDGVTDAFLCPRGPENVTVSHDRISPLLSLLSPLSFNITPLSF